MASDNKFSEQQLRSLLQKVKVPDDLEYCLNANLSHQIETEKRPRSRWLPTLAASLVLAAGLGLWWEHVPTEPAFISAVEEHVEHEVAVAGYLTREEFGVWQQVAAFPLTRLKASVELTKDCWVDGYTLKHLRLRYPDGNSVDVLVSSAPLPAAAQGAGRGKQFFWRGTGLPTGAQVLALYANESSAAEVDQLLQTWSATSRTAKPLSM